MVKIKAHIQQYVERLATVELEVDVPEGGLSQEQIDDLLARARAADGAEWGDGDDAYAVRVYSLQDEAGGTVWEDC